VERNRVANTRPDVASGDRSRLGYGIEVHYGAEAELLKNTLGGNPFRVGAFAEGVADQRR